MNRPETRRLSLRDSNNNNSWSNSVDLPMTQHSETCTTVLMGVIVKVMLNVFTISVQTTRTLTPIATTTTTATAIMWCGTRYFAHPCWRSPWCRRYWTCVPCPWRRQHNQHRQQLQLLQQLYGPTSDAAHGALHPHDNGGHGVDDADRVHNVHEEDNTTTTNDDDNQNYFCYNNVNWLVTQYTAPCTSMMEA